MKKNLLTITVAFWGLTAYAQTPISDVHLVPYGYAIPAEFTSDNHTKFAVIENGNINVYNNSMISVYQMVVPASGPHRLEVYDFDAHLQEPDDDNGLAITQTLFNNDDNYEYFVIDGYEEEMYRGMSVMSEDGSILWSWHATGNNWGSAFLVKWDGAYFIVTMEESEDEFEFTWYRINQTTQSITQVENPAINIWPTIAERHQTITVELGENCNASEIQVVNAVGQTVKRIPVHVGQNKVQLKASNMNSGMYIINARGNGARSSYKIVIK